MKSRIENIPALRTMYTAVDAQQYNTMRLGLLRLGSPLSIELTNLRHLEVLADQETWICIDKSLSDLPVIAWTNFQIKNRCSLNLPVKCQLRFYHAHAGLIVNKILKTITSSINNRLQQQYKVTKTDIARFPSLYQPL